MNSERAKVRNRDFRTSGAFDLIVLVCLSVAFACTTMRPLEIEAVVEDASLAHARAQQLYRSSRLPERGSDREEARRRNTRQGGRALVPLRVVLHRARAERVEVRVDRHVLRRQVREMTHDLRLRQLRQRGSAFGEHARREQLFDAPLGHVEVRQPQGAAARLGEVEQELAVVVVSHGVTVGELAELDHEAEGLVAGGLDELFQPIQIIVQIVVGKRW